MEWRRWRVSRETQVRPVSQQLLDTQQRRACRWLENSMVCAQRFCIALSSSNGPKSVLVKMVDLRKHHRLRMVHGSCDQFLHSTTPTICIACHFVVCLPFDALMIGMDLIFAHTDSHLLIALMVLIADPDLILIYICLMSNSIFEVLITSRLLTTRCSTHAAPGRRQLIWCSCSS